MGSNVGVAMRTSKAIIMRWVGGGRWRVEGGGGNIPSNASLWVVCVHFTAQGASFVLSSLFFVLYW